MFRANWYRWLRALTLRLLNNIFCFCRMCTNSGSFQFHYYKFLIVLWSVLRFHVRVLYLMCVNSIALYASPCLLLPRPDRTHCSVCSAAHSYCTVQWRSAYQLLSSSDWSGNYNFLSLNIEQQCYQQNTPSLLQKVKKQNDTEFSNGGEHEYWNRLGCSTVGFGRKIKTGEPAYICHPECKDRKFVL
jgi:hypothetical protein